MRLEQDDKILFLGGLNTGAGRKENDLTDMGRGFAMITAAALDAKHPDLKLRFANASSFDNNTQTMMESMDEVCQSQNPTIVIIFAGYQDAILAEKSHNQATYHEYSRFNRNLRQLVSHIQTKVTRRIILIEPFLLDINSMNRALRTDINQKIQIIREIAKDCRCDFVALDGLMNELAIQNGNDAYIAKDGLTYHPATHHIIAQRLLEHFE